MAALSWRFYFSCWCCYWPQESQIFFYNYNSVPVSSLTRCPDLYLKEGGKDFGKVNPSNFKPIFSSEILSESLWASVLLPTTLRGVIAMDVDKLNKEIISALDTDKAVESYLADITNTQYARWSKDTLGFVWIDERIYAPPSGDLHLHVLCSYHDHPVSGHFGINKTLALIFWEYTWPSICTFVTDYCRSCTTCSWNKAKCHKPYGLLCQLPIPRECHGLPIEFRRFLMGLWCQPCSPWSADFFCNFFHWNLLRNGLATPPASLRGLAQIVITWHSI